MVNETIVTQLVKQVAIPKKAAIIRLAGSGNARPSAIANPFAKPPLNWATPPAVISQLLPPDEAIMLVSNDPLCCMTFTDKNSAGAALIQFWLIGGSPDNGVITVAPGQTANLDTDLYCSIPVGGARAWHGPRLYAKVYKGKYYLWCDASSTPGAANNLGVFTNTTAMAAGDAVTVSIYRLNEYDELQVFSARIPGPILAATVVTQLTLPAADYYRVVITGDDDNTTAQLDFIIQNRATSEICVHLALPDLSERQMNLIQGIRVFGASSHAMNLVSDQNATGGWVGDQPESMICWTAYIRGASGANGFQKLGAQQGNEFMELKKFNPYTFVTPEDNDDWKYVHPFSFNSLSQVTNILNRDMTEFHYTIVYFKSGGTTLAADASRNLQLEFFYCVEYSSDGLWPMMGVSPASEDDVAAAIKVLASMENITHNPAFGDIMRTIGKYVRLSAPVLALLGPYGKAASIAAAGIGAGLGKIGYRTKKTARPEGEGEDGERPLKAQTVAPALLVGPNDG